MPETTTTGVRSRRRMSAPNPCRDAAVHPSLRGEKPASMNTQLSSYEFRAYKRGTGLIVLHMRTTVLIKTDVSFSTSYLRNITGLLALPPSRSFDLDGMSVAEACEIPYDGRTLAMDLWVPVHTNLRECPSCLGRLDLRFCFSFYGAPFEARIQHDVTVRRIRQRA